ncbi:hypothetical protein COU76_05505 [Candidatus Peregrinibacteria bacterium CG10_big_fil_rev_8_21_14_0_10_49_10]|nr:MAG: hypothetical protein COU76_05505 [Candidatus Peregrinibacteria bacterium CG10_big_fil_rev_8_21_14_0_10_49_10]
MSSQTVGLLIGGLLPAVIFGLVNLAARMVSASGMAAGAYLVGAGLGAIGMGIIFLLVSGDRTFSTSSGLFSVLVGLGWGLGTGSVVLAISRYGSPIGVLTPLFNMNTLITVLLALWIFAEWREVRVPQLLVGSVLIVLGGVLVARA